ncbi:hypothetical protein F5Y10DRAFT_270895 [Nemania abortiva]|nr:hypothetical protein F5Y10DRAFT_270895 [Nemania abortiva]
MSAPVQNNGGNGQGNGQNGQNNQNARPNADEVIQWDEIDFWQFTGDPFAEMINRMANAPPAPGITFEDRLRALPNELLLQIINSISPIDRMTTAFAFPDLFLNNDRINVIVLDVDRQLAIPSNILESEEIEAERVPLLVAAIRSGRFGLDAFRYIYEQYQQLAASRNVDPGVFLNSDFPLVAPVANEDQVPPEHRDGFRRRHRRYVLSPLHQAVHSARRDIARFLIEQGANVHHTVLMGNRGNVTPFQFAAYCANDDENDNLFRTRDPQRRQTLENIAFDIMDTYADTILAYTDNFTATTMDFRLTLLAGFEEVALVLHRLTALTYQLVFGGPPLRPEYQALNDGALATALEGRYPMPRFILHMVRQGAVYDPQAMRHRRTSMTSVTLGIPNPVIENVEAAYLAELERSGMSGEDYVRLLRGTFAIGQLALSDANLLAVARFVEMMIEHGFVDGQRYFLWLAMQGGTEAVETRRLLLGRLSDEVIDGVAFRRAIVYGDRETFDFILNRFQRAGRDIDQVLEGDDLLVLEDNPFTNPRARFEIGMDGEWEEIEPAPDRLGFFGSALNTAIAEYNWYAAHRLLDLGADPELVEDRLRHRIRRARDRYRQNGRLRSAPYEYGPVDNEERAGHLLYLAEQLVDNELYPLPPAQRSWQRRRLDLPQDAEENDSDSGEVRLLYLFEHQLYESGQI